MKRCLLIGLSLSAFVGCRLYESGGNPPDVASNETTASKQESVTAPQAELVQVGYATGANQEAPTTPDYLSQAAVAVEKGDKTTAISFLKIHVQQYPEQLMIRIYLAELLYQQRQWLAAQLQFEQFVADAQASAGPPANKLVHCHTRLMAIAQERNDIYAEHLHRGIGFVLLSRQLDAGVAEPEVGFQERILCKAVLELQEAKRCQPDEARPYCYLHEVFRKLDQPRPAERAREQAKALSAQSFMTPIEKQGLWQ